MRGDDMNRITVDFSKKEGNIKPLHCVNNGPASQSASSHIVELYREMGVPFARNHDASFFSPYGGEHTVDVHAVFPNFDADPEDPSSYDFTCTDNYIAVTEAAGTHHFYRLGSRIEHEVKKYGTVMPKDFKKWAVICEHIVRHYTEGWADGFRYDMPYWEIWNEADLDADDALNKRCWSGTAKEFYAFFRVALEHLKTAFPHLKIGGPACAHANDVAWVRGLLDELGEIKPDFFSWHIYFSEIDNMLDRAKLVRDILDEYGLTECESILNEWNYVRGRCWSGPFVKYAQNVRVGEGPKCSSYTAAAMLAAQHSSIDMLMLYDARPSGWCSLFKPCFNEQPLKSYYSLCMFNKLYRAGEALSCKVDGDDIYALAAADEKTSWVMFTHYNDEDETEGKSVTLSLENVKSDNGVRVEYYLLDETHDQTLVRTDEWKGTEFKTELSLPLFTMYLIKIEKL